MNTMRTLTVEEINFVAGGSSAKAHAFAEASGFNAQTSTSTFAKATPFSSESASTSEAKS